MKKILYAKEGKKFFVDDTTKDYHCQFGVVKKADLRKKAGTKVKTNMKKELTILDAGFMDQYRRIKRGAQIVSFKDIGAILAYTGIDKKSIAVDAGAGSGALAAFLAHICKEVTTYEIRDDFIKIVKTNKTNLDLKNLKIKKKNIFRGIDEKDVDLITLDLPDPWNAIGVAEKALKVGGYIVSYSPTVPQVADFVNIIKKKPDLMHQRTIELIKREWEVEERKVRPMTTQNVHTGFLTFVRKIS
jgi:tRNA (adenine57-N1/adenine58-N1)-methyltransferase